MASTSAAAAASSSSSSISTRKKYDVFISFRGEDTRSNFTSHLYRAFSDKKIEAYIDEVSLNKGAEISPALIKAIEESEIAVIILSKDYGSSSWCLDELNHILRCKETNNQKVVPVFYGVDPSDVRKQRGSYASAFDAHEVPFKDRIEKIQQWRNSLTTVANLSGFDSSNFRLDSELLKAIVEDILEKLRHLSQCHEFKHLVGIEQRIQQVKSLLNLDSLDVRIIGIWGMGGIGKTTLAHAVFNRFAHRFEGCCFLENVKEESKKHGKIELRRRIFSILLDEDFKMVDQFVMNKLHRTKVLIALDDVDDAEQLEYLVEDRNWLCRGSKIIITTRDLQVLKNVDPIETYVVEELNFDESWHLFCSKAFQQSSPSTDYDDLLAWVVHYCKGIPLALTVLGRHLRSKSAKEWKSELDKLKKIPNEKVHQVLKISYDGLDCNEKELFLDIACFFKREDLDFVKRILDSYGTRYMDSGVRVLIDKALITIESNKLHMHDLLQEMGWKIICQESKEPGERSRLCSAEDILKVLKHNTGTKAIQGMSLETYDLREVIRLNPRVFKKMFNLKYIKFSISEGKECFEFSKGLQWLPDELRYLFWNGYPLKSLPSSFNPTKLVELHLPYRKLEYLWEGDPDLANLKVLDLSCSNNLFQIPNFSRAVNIEKINISECKHLENLPSSVGKLKYLQSLRLLGCNNINEFPKLPVNLKHLDIAWTSIKEVAPSIEHLSHLEGFYLTGCKKLKRLPITICKLKSLLGFYLHDCAELKSFPEILDPMEHLTQLNLRGTGITELPSSIEKLVKLQFLHLQNCKNLQLIPKNVYSLPLSFLGLSNCPVLKTLPPFSSDLCCLAEEYFILNLDGSGVSELPQEFFKLPLHRLNLSRTGIRTIPESIKYSKLLFELNITDCKFLESLPELPVNLTKVYAKGCTSLQLVSNSSIGTVSDTSSLLTRSPNYCRQELDFTDCAMLDLKNIFTNFQIRALRCGTAQTHFSDLGVSICFPGVEIPQWFNCRNDHGCSVVAPDCHDTTNFIGFASCVVFSRKLNDIIFPKLRGFSVACYCDVSVETNNGRMCHNFVIELQSSDDYSGSNHVLMWYFHRGEIDVFPAKQISFKFRIAVNYIDYIISKGIEEEEDYPTFKVERCGIRMLQLQDAKEFGIISSDFVRSASNADTNELEPSGDESIDLETNEPDPKRAKFSG